MKYEYSCIMLELVCQNWKALTSIIDASDLSDNDKQIEDEPHITVLYGILPEITSKDIANIVSKWRMPEIILDEIGIFENEKFDVLKINVRSNDLSSYWIQSKQELENESKFQIYQPHITIAYLKPGTGKKYLNAFDLNKLDIKPIEWKVSFGGEQAKEPLFIKINTSIMKYDEFSKTGDSYRSKFISGYAKDFEFKDDKSKIKNVSQLDYEEGHDKI